MGLWEVLCWVSSFAARNSRQRTWSAPPARAGNLADCRNTSLNYGRNTGPGVAAGRHSGRYAGVQWRLPGLGAVDVQTPQVLVCWDIGPCYLFFLAWKSDPRALRTTPWCGAHVRIKTDAATSASIARAGAFTEPTPGDLDLVHRWPLSGELPKAHRSPVLSWWRAGAVLGRRDFLHYARLLRAFGRNGFSPVP